MLHKSIYAILATLFWSGSFVTARLVVGDISPTLLGTLRWIIALIVLGSFTFPTVRKEWPTAKTFLPQIFLSAFAGVVAATILAYMAAETSSSLTMSLIKSVTSPLIVITCALLGERQTRNTWIGSVIALLGTLYLVCGGNLNHLLEIKFVIGDLLMLVAAVGFVVYSILLRKAPAGLSQSTILTLMIVCAVIMLVPYTIWEWANYGMVFKFQANVFFTIFYASIVASIGAWGTWNLALATAGPSFSSMIYYSMPLWTGLLAYLILGEEITSVHYISGLMIVGGILLASKKAKTVGKTIEN